MPDTSADGVDHVDVRGPRFAAWVTTGMLAAVIVLSAVSIRAATALLAFQAVVFAIGAIRGPRSHPYGWIYARLVAPRIGSATEREPVPPLRFAQLVGLVFALIGLRWFRRRDSAARRSRDSLGALRRLPQRGLRYLPGLQALSPGRAITARR
jgi:hypothetical protein